MSIRLTDKASVKNVIREMTLEEKALLITGQSAFGTIGIDRLGIKPALFVDAGGGVNLRQYIANSFSIGKIRNENIEKRTGTLGFQMLAHMVKIMNNITTRENLDQDERDLLEEFLAQLKKLVPCGDLPSCFPAAMLLGATWDPNAVLKCAEAVGKEASAFGVDMLLGTPCINIERNPLGGRSFEGYSEDPYLISELAPNYCIGVQSQSVIADVKHLAANNQEFERQTINEIIPERTLREIYFPGFKACVQKGKVKNVMTAYNYINGVACAHNKWMIEDVLRGEWGFDGFVVSDWGGVYDQVEAIKAGNDVSEPGPRSIQPILDAVNKGELDEALIDKAVENFLNVLVEMPVMKGRKYTDIDSQASKKVAYEVAAEGITLLKNKEQLLPLSADTQVAFFGEKAQHFYDCGVGSGRVHTNKTSSLIESVQEVIGPDKVLVDEIRLTTEVVILVAAAAGQEGCDRENMDLDPQDDAMVKNMVIKAKELGKKIVLILNIASPVEMMNYTDDVDAVLCVYFPGQEGAHVTSDILFGKVNPSGKLPLTFPKYYYDCPSFGNFPGEFGEVMYGEGIFVGYRYYDIRHIEPLFPFGFGLSYTTFDFTDISLNQSIIDVDKNDLLQVAVTVKNTGKYFGKEVVQLYIEDEISKLQKPLKELKAFQKIALQPGESKKVVLTVDKEKLSSYDTDAKSWACEPGYFKVLVGNSSRNILLTARFKVTGTNPYGYNRKTMFKTLNDDPRVVNIILKHMPAGSVDRVILKNLNNFSPFEPFEKTWKNRLTMFLTSQTPEEIEEIFNAICNEIKTLDISDDALKYQETVVY
jgi:Beta-glucosidase-related glycosidases